MKTIPLSQELKHGRPVSCEARHEGDEWACACGKRWGVDDPEPPVCSRARHVFPSTPMTVAARQEIVRPPEPVKSRRLPLPEELTESALIRMHLRFTTSLGITWPASAKELEGMRQAYRALLDSLES